jgi:hypothetical protein
VADAVNDDRKHGDVLADEASQNDVTQPARSYPLGHAVGDVPAKEGADHVLYVSRALMAQETELTGSRSKARE